MNLAEIFANFAKVPFMPLWALVFSAGAMSLVAARRR